MIYVAVNERQDVVGDHGGWTVEAESLRDGDMMRLGPGTLYYPPLPPSSCKRSNAVARPRPLWTETPQGTHTDGTMAQRTYKPKSRFHSRFSHGFGPGSESTAIALYRRARARIACVGGKFMTLNRTQSSLVIFGSEETTDLAVD